MSIDADISQLNIVIIHDKFPPNYAGGGEYVVYQIAKHMVSKGCNVNVITAGDPSITEFDGIRTTRLPCSSYAFNCKWKQIAKLAAGADVIHGFTYHGLYPAYRTAKYLNIPFIKMALALFGNEWREMRGPLVGRLFIWYERFLIGLPSAKQIFISEFSYLYAKSHSLNTENSCVVEPGISLEDYSANDEKPYVMFAGKIESRKGIRLVLNAAQKLPHIPFLITGWGAELSNKNVPKNVQVVPFENRLQLAALLSKARIFAFPTRVETFGLAVAEAMASGCAIVSSSQLPFAGIHVEKDNYEQLISAIEDLWNDPLKCAQMAQQNIELSKQYNWTSHIEKTIKIYHELSIVSNSDSKKTIESSTQALNQKMDVQK